MRRVCRPFGTFVWWGCHDTGALPLPGRLVLTIVFCRPPSGLVVVLCYTGALPLPIFCRPFRATPSEMCIKGSSCVPIPANAPTRYCPKIVFLVFIGFYWFFSGRVAVSTHKISGTSKLSEGFGRFVRRLRTLRPKASDCLSEGFGLFYAALMHRRNSVPYPQQAASARYVLFPRTAPRRCGCCAVRRVPAAPRR